MLRSAIGRLKKLSASFFQTPKERVRINFGGKLFIAFTLAVGFGAVNTGNNVLYLLLSFLLALMAVSGLLSRYNLKGLKVQLFPPEEVWCCKEAPFEVLVENRKRFPSFLVEVLQREAGVRVLFKLVERVSRKRTLLRFDRRGVYPLRTLEVRSSFPFGLFERSFTLDLGLEVVVYPLPKEPPFALPPVGKREEGLSEEGKAGTEAVVGLRDYAGEGFSQVSWKAFARLGQLYAKEFSGEDAAPRVWVDVSALPGSKEEKLSYAAYLILKFVKRGYAVGLRCLDGKVFPPKAGTEHLREMLRCLAVA
ncbi:MAG: DUF58 domain-containing protein [Aquificae bacterium]|nr:DUF58 domain-containing protein [Aquificota bacterium]